MNTRESDIARDDSAVKARIEKIRGLSLVREELAPPRSGRWSPIVLALCGVLTLQTLALGYVLLFRGGAAQGDAAGPRDAIAPVAAPSGTASAPAVVDSSVRLQAQGFIIAMRQATVSTRVAGIVTDVPVDVGDRVEKGQVVGVLNSDLAVQDLQLAEKQLSSLRSQVERERARREQARDEYRREQLLEQGQYTTHARISEKRAASVVAETALNSAMADLEVGAVRVQQQRNLLDNYTIRAPFSGIVIERNSQVGELVAPMSAGGSFTRTGICTIVDMDSLVLLVDVGEQQIQNVEVGQKVTFRLYSDERVEIQGRVERIVPSADRAKGTLQVRISILGKDPRVLPGMRANVDFI